MSWWILDVLRIRAQQIEVKLKEKEMAKAKKRSVMFKVTDGFTPMLADGVLKLRTPIALTLAPGEVINLDLGVKSSVPLLIFGANHLLKRGLVLQNGGAVDAGSSIVIKIANTTPGIEMVEVKETVAKAVVLDSGDIEIS